MDESIVPETKPLLHTFHVFLKRHGERVLRAYKYTEDPDSGRTVFHRLAAGTDDETFFRTDEIVGIEREISEAEILAGLMTHEDFQKLLDSLPSVGDQRT